MMTNLRSYTMYITTKYLNPTNNKGARIKATASTGDTHTLTIPYDHALSASGCHSAAARELAVFLEFKGELVVVPTETGYIFATYNETLFI
jgi:hypothetical protein